MSKIILFFILLDSVCLSAESLCLKFIERNGLDLENVEMHYSANKIVLLDENGKICLLENIQLSDRISLKKLGYHDIVINMNWKEITNDTFYIQFYEKVSELKEATITSNKTHNVKTIIIGNTKKPSKLGYYGFSPSIEHHFIINPEIKDTAFKHLFLRDINFYMSQIFKDTLFDIVVRVYSPPDSGKVTGELDLAYKNILSLGSLLFEDTILVSKRGWYTVSPKMFLLKDIFILSLSIPFMPTIDYHELPTLGLYHHGWMQKNFDYYRLVRYMNLSGKGPKFFTGFKVFRRETVKPAINCIIKAY